VNTSVAIRERDLAIVRAILDATLPHEAVVRVFGSRARGNSRRASDLDLAIDAYRPLTAKEQGALADAFEESDLPYFVDVIDVHTASAGFLALIERDWTPLPG
jgi:predicted nucleotidyltransferase